MHLALQGARDVEEELWHGGARAGRGRGEPEVERLHRRLVVAHHHLFGVWVFTEESSQSRFRRLS